ncbi:MAG: TonB-dependent receptor [Armatimonadota bacterium]|nr:TonB-dependent receptor [Armatimonadota bacterium]
MRVRFVLVVACVLAVSASTALAQDPPPEFELPDVTSPGRRVQPAATSPASVSVLTAADLRRLGVRTVGEAIAFMPETLARAYGGPGSLITPSVRGSGAEQVLVLLDGVPLNGVFSGNVDLSTIPIDDVERIEVLRGPFSAIYGSGALGGVISVVTRRRARPAVTLGGGSLGVTALGISAPLPGAAGDAGVSLRLDGAAGDRPNSDLRGGSLTLRAGGARGERSWDIRVFGAALARGTPGSAAFPTPLARQDDRRIVASFSTAQTRGALSDRLRVAVHYDAIDYRDPMFGIADRHAGTAWSAEWQRSVRRSAARVVTWGAEGQLQQLSSTSAGARSAALGAVYVQDDRALGPRLLLSVGLRVDWHSVWGAQVNPRVGLVYFARPDVRLRLAAGRTFRGPAFADLYYPFDGFVTGNPLLRPERAWSVDAGLEAVLRTGLTLRATAFWSDVRDLILYVPDASFVFSPQNIGSASVLGASVEVEGRPAPRWTARGSVTWIHPIDAVSRLDLPNRPRLSAVLSLTRELQAGASLTASAVAVGERYADPANAVRLPAYVTTALVLQVPVRETTGLRVSVQNVFDVRYEPLQGYPAPGRTLFAEVVLRR